MDLIRIGDKMVDRERVHRLVDRLFELRQAGASQAETARALGTDRTLVSRLETLGEVRKGGSIALVDFPVGNKSQLEAVAIEEGVDMVFLMTEEERWAYIKDKSGLELLNEIMDLITRLRSFEAVVFLGSNRRIQLVEALLDREILGVELGASPLSEDVHVDPEQLRGILRGLNGRGGETDTLLSEPRRGEGKEGSR